MKLNRVAFSLLEVLLAVATLAVALLLVVALGLSVMRRSQRAQDIPVGTIAAENVLNQLIYNVNADTAANRQAWFNMASTPGWRTGTFTVNKINFGYTPIIMDPTTFTLEYSKNVYVKPQGGVTGLSIIPEPAIASGASPDRPKNLFRGLSGTNPVLAGTSALNLDGALIGKGSVTAGTNVTFQGPSVFETDPGKAVAIYAKRDVIMNALPPAVAANLDPASNSASHHALHHHGHHHMSSHGHWGHGHGHHHTNTFTSASIPNALGNLDGNDVLLAGLVYAGGNFTTNLGPGTMYLRGALVAYGGNADLDETPGTLGGIINLTSKGASVTFDPNYIANSMQLSGPSRLVLAMQNSY